MTVDSLTSRGYTHAATRRIAASSALPQKVLRASWGARKVAPVPFRHERSLRSCAARVSRREATICSRGD